MGFLNRKKSPEIPPIADVVIPIPILQALIREMEKKYSNIEWQLVVDLGKLWLARITYRAKDSRMAADVARRIQSEVERLVSVLSFDTLGAYVELRRLDWKGDRWAADIYVYRIVNGQFRGSAAQ